MMTKNDPLDVELEISRIEEMINSGPMQRMRQQSRSEGDYIRPKKASSIVLVKGAPGEEEIVMGKRNKALKFMPGALVFPGGRVDRGDSRIVAADQLDAITREKLNTNMVGKVSPKSAHGLAIAAIRELCEETGLLVGKTSQTPPKHKDWAVFSQNNMAPSINPLRLLARAVTPPGVHRRFDTWFFVMRLEEQHLVPEEGFISSGELEDLQWIKPEDAMRHDTREITRVILVELMNRLKQDPELTADFPAPSYETRRDRFRRKLM